MNKYLITVIVCILLAGCSEQPKTKYDWSTTIQLDTPGGIIDSVIIYRDHDGYLWSEWFVDFVSGTKTMLTLGSWAPQPEKDIPHGPIRGQAGKKDLKVEEGQLIQTIGFSDKGKAHKPGEYYLALYLKSSPGIWEQPEGTKELLEKHGQVDEYGNFHFSVLARFSLPKFSASN